MIIVHIGLRKAGSTSIQAFLHANGEALRELSIDYPLIGRAARNNHLNLAREIRGLTEFDPAEGTVAELSAYWRGADAEVMILSAEAFEECETAEALKLADLRRRADEDIRIVMIIRDLIGLMPSSYAQMVKLGVKIHEFDDFFKKRMRDRRIDYFATAQRWADAFGWESLRVRVLDRDHLLNGDLVDDFLSIAGVDPSEDRARRLRRPGAANVSPGWRVVEAIRALYGGRHGLPDGHPLADAVRHSRELREKTGRRALVIGARLGWNDKGRYLTRKQARRCLEAYQATIGALNMRLPSRLPKPRGLKGRGFVARDAVPDIAQIPPAELRAFYDELGGLG